MSSRWSGFVVWALVAASAAFWGLRVTASARSLPATAVVPPAPVAAQGPMPRLFGAVAQPASTQPAARPESDRFQLFGLIAPKQGSEGAMALVSVDGQPARAWRVGATIDGRTTLLAVARRSADFGPAGGPTAFTLELPEPASPATGTLAGVQSQQGQGPLESRGGPGAAPGAVPGGMMGGPGGSLARGMNFRASPPGVISPTYGVPGGYAASTPPGLQVPVQGVPANDTPSTRDNEQ